jgi:hypothetical protein
MRKMETSDRDGEGREIGKEMKIWGDGDSLEMEIER